MPTAMPIAIRQLINTVNPKSIPTVAPVIMFDEDTPDHMTMVTIAIARRAKKV